MYISWPTVNLNLIGLMFLANKILSGLQKILTDKKEELDTIRSYKVGELIRSKIQWLIESEKPSFFCNLGKSNL